MEKSILKHRFALLASILLVLSAMFSTYSIRDVLTMQEAQGFALDTNLVYLVFAPLFNVLDMMTALSLTQHASWLTFLFIAGLITSFKLITLKHGFIRWLLILLLPIAAIAFLYTVAVLMPRPMTSLIVPDDTMLIVDFHSHTNASHDANTSFDAEDNRMWHEKSGFDAVFVTDHYTFESVVIGKGNNAENAKYDVLLLDGIELQHMGGHVLALCATSFVRIENGYTWKTNAYGCDPLLVQANPGPINDSDTVFRERGIEALEIHDGAPIAIEEVKNRQLWMDKAKSLNIAIVSGSDNHGWAYAASGWSILHISDWEMMNADELALAITQRIREKGFAAVQVVERHMVLPARSWIGHVTMPVQLIWQMLATLSWQERLSWMVWAWILSFAWIKVTRYEA